MKADGALRENLTRKYLQQILEVVSYLHKTCIRCEVSGIHQDSKLFKASCTFISPLQVKCLQKQEKLPLNGINKAQTVLAC